jgi:predicted transcriptional regulator of viral defense system
MYTKHHSDIYTKNLGVEAARMLTTLASQGQIVFTVQDALKISQKSYSAAIQALRRLQRAGWVVRLNAGQYAIVPLEAGNQAIPTANRLVIARALAGSALYYVSHDSALEAHNMLTRPVTIVTVTTTRRLGSRSVLAVPYRFVAARPENLWGFAPVWVMPQEQVQVSDLERTILDGLARPDLCAGVSEVATGLWMRRDDLDWKKLVTYAHRLGNQAAAKRLGYLLELYELGTEAALASLHDLVGPSYAPLEPLLPSNGHYLARWRLRVNLNPDNLKAILTT